MIVIYPKQKNKQKNQYSEHLEIPSEVSLNFFCLSVYFSQLSLLYTFDRKKILWVMTCYFNLNYTFLGYDLLLSVK